MNFGSKSRLVLKLNWELKTVCSHMMVPHVLCGSTCLMSIWIFWHILLPCSWYTFIHNVISLSVVPERVPFKLCMTFHQCMQDKAPQYLNEYCISFSSMYAGQSSSVFEGILHIILRHWQSTASSLSRPSPSYRAMSSLNFWPSGLCCCWSDGMELSIWRFT